jgi:hypothetical protein
MFTSAASNPRSGRDIDTEHGSGRADPEGLEFGRANPVDREGRPGRAHDRKSRSAKEGPRDHAWRHFATRPQKRNRLRPDFPPRPLTTLAPRNWGFTGLSPFSSPFSGPVTVFRGSRSSERLALGAKDIGHINRFV